MCLVISDGGLLIFLLLDKWNVVVEMENHTHYIEVGVLVSS